MNRTQTLPPRSPESGEGDKCQKSPQYNTVSAIKELRIKCNGNTKEESVNSLEDKKGLFDKSMQSETLAMSIKG